MKEDKNMDNATDHGEELPQHLVDAIHKLAHSGTSHEAISSVLGLKLEVVTQLLDKDPSQVASLTEAIREKSRKSRVQYSRLKTTPMMAPNGNYYEQSHLEPHPSMVSESVMPNPRKKAKICMESSIYCTKYPQTPQLHEVTLPTFIYSYNRGTHELHRTSLITGEQSKHRVPSYNFKDGCCWSEVPGGSLLITGGGFPTVGEVVRIDARREFAVSRCPPMLTPRREHAAVYHCVHLYVLGGWSESTRLRKCERYVCAENRWEALPPLSRTCCRMSGVVVESSLYALGGLRGADALDLVQKLSLESLTWELMQLRLPYADSEIPCFKLNDTEVYLVVNATLYSFTGLEVRPLRTLSRNIHVWYGASYYRSGTLYCSNQWGAVGSYEIGSLTS
jgi:hypothetical protein